MKQWVIAFIILAFVTIQAVHVQEVKELQHQIKIMKVANR